MKRWITDPTFELAKDAWGDYCREIDLRLQRGPTRTPDIRTYFANEGAKLHGTR